MEQSTCRSRPAVVRFALALLLSGVAATAPTFADDGVEDESGDGGAAVLRPRWIEPQRGTGAIAPPETTRDWRREGRVLIHAERDETRLAAAVEGMLEGLLEARDVGQRTVDATTSTDQVRFFHAEDAAMAANLAAVLELVLGEVRVRDLTDYRPQPARGALEIWLR